ncbi:permease [Bacillus sp. JCM 19046]|nr:permease [Bacillus sp. JCM 19045]GAF15624.1 permease [Bacillus sp. JCM 19046]
MKLIIAYTIALVLWASAFPGIRIGLTHYGPIHLSLMRLLIASIVLLLIGLSLKIPLPRRKDIPSLLALGFSGFAVYHTALSIGEQSVGAGVASILVSTTPILAAILANRFFNEKLGIRSWSAMVISFFGIVLLVIGGGDSFYLTLGALIILIGAFSESNYFAFQQRYLEQYGFIPLTIYTIVAGSLFMLPFLPGLGQTLMSAPLHVNLTVLYLGLFPTVVPYFCLAFAIKQSGTSEATSFLFLTPALAILFAWIWIGEVPTPMQLLGGCIVLIGVSFIVYTAKVNRRTGI